jgi:flavin-dependent dehydrogenase
MKRGLKVLALATLLCGLIAGGCGWWLYTRARAQADVGMGLQRKSLELYDRSDAVKGTPEEDRLVEEGRRLEQSGDEILGSARSSRTWALVSGIISIILVLASIAAMMLHLKRKEADSSS